MTTRGGRRERRVASRLEGTLRGLGRDGSAGTVGRLGALVALVAVARSARLARQARRSVAAEDDLGNWPVLSNGRSRRRLGLGSRDGTNSLGSNRLCGAGGFCGRGGLGRGGVGCADGTLKLVAVVSLAGAGCLAVGGAELRLLLLGGDCGGVETARLGDGGGRGSLGLGERGPGLGEGSLGGGGGPLLGGRGALVDGLGVTLDDSGLRHSSALGEGSDAGTRLRVTLARPARLVEGALFAVVELGSALAVAATVVVRPAGGLEREREQRWKEVGQ